MKSRKLIKITTVQLNITLAVLFVVAMLALMFSVPARFYSPGYFMEVANRPAERDQEFRRIVERNQGMEALASAEGYQVAQSIYEQTRFKVEKGLPC